MALKHVKTSSLDVIAAEVIGIKVHVSDECIFDTIEEAAEVYNVNPTIVRIKEGRFIIKYLPLRKAGDNPRSTANKLLRMCDEYLDDLLESTSSISVVDLSISSSSTEILSSHSSLSSTESSITSISSNSSISISSNSSDSTFTSNTSITSNSSDSYSSRSTSSYSSSSISSDSSDSSISTLSLSSSSTSSDSSDSSITTSSVSTSSTSSDSSDSSVSTSSVSYSSMSSYSSDSMASDSSLSSISEHSVSSKSSESNSTLSINSDSTLSSHSDSSTSSSSDTTGSTVSTSSTSSDSTDSSASTLSISTSSTSSEDSDSSISTLSLSTSSTSSNSSDSSVSTLSLSTSSTSSNSSDSSVSTSSPSSSTFTSHSTQSSETSSTQTSVSSGSSISSENSASSQTSNISSSSSSESGLPSSPLVLIEFDTGSGDPIDEQGTVSPSTIGSGSWVPTGYQVFIPSSYIQLASNGIGIFDSQEYTLGIVLRTLTGTSGNFVTAFSYDFTSSSAPTHANNMLIGRPPSTNSNVRIKNNDSGASEPGITTLPMGADRLSFHHRAVRRNSTFRSCWLNGSNFTGDITHGLGNITFYNQEVWIGHSVLSSDESYVGNCIFAYFYYYDRYLSDGEMSQVHSVVQNVMAGRGVTIP